MSQSDPPLTLREKMEASQARANLLREERMLRKEQKPLWLRYLPELLSSLSALGIIYALGAWVIWPVRDLRLMKEREKDSISAPSAINTASAQYLQGDIQQAAASLLSFLEKHPDSYPGNILMARIELARRQPAAAVKCLEAARETALDRSEIDGWVKDVKSRFPAP